MIIGLNRHLQVLFATLGDMRRTPMSTINTLLIVAITLLLPSLLYVAVKTGHSLSGNWEGRPQISIFFEAQIGEREAQLIFEEVQLHPAIELAEFISKAQALQEFEILLGDQSTLERDLAYIGENPLPASIVVMPTLETANSEKLVNLKEELGGIDGIESIRLDLEWTDRFNAILQVVTRGAIVLSALLALALILIVGNTIKLLIMNRRQEIEITKLIGGTDGFVRRPFLYYGALFGLIGGLITLGLLLLSGFLLEVPLQQLAALYETNTILYALTPLDMICIVAVGTVICWVAARWSVAQHLRHIKPR